MVGTITRIIEKAAKVSIEDGQAKYEIYFGRSDKKYESYKKDVDTLLIKDGYREVIV